MRKLTNNKQIQDHKVHALPESFACFILIYSLPLKLVFKLFDMGFNEFFLLIDSYSSHTLFLSLSYK